MNSNTKSKISTVVVFLSTLSIFLLTLPQTISAQQNPKKAEWYCKDGSCYTTRPSSYEGYYECYEKDFTKCPNLSTGSRTATGSASRTSSGSSRPSSTAGTRAQTSSGASTGTDSRASARTTTTKPPVAVTASGTGSGAANPPSSSSVKAATQTTPTAQTPSTSAPTSPSSKDAAISGTEDFTTGSPAKAQSPAAPKNPAAPATGAAVGENPPPTTPGANTSGGAASQTCDKLSNEAPVQFTSQSTIQPIAVVTGISPRQDCINRCKTATDATDKAYNDFIDSCAELDESISDEDDDDNSSRKNATKNKTCFERAKKCNLSMTLDQVDLTTSNFFESMAQYAAATHGINTQPTKKSSLMNEKCPQISGKTYNDLKEKMDSNLEILEKEKKRLEDHLSEVNKVRLEEQKNNKKLIEEAQNNLKDSQISKKKEHEITLRNKTREISEMQTVVLPKFDSSINKLRGKIAGLQQRTYDLRKGYDLNKIHEICKVQASIAASKLTEDKKIKLPYKHRAAIANDTYTNCTTERENLYKSSIASNDQEISSAIEEVSSLESAKKNTLDDIDSRKNELNQIEQDYGTDISNEQKKFQDLVLRIAEDDKQKSNETALEVSKTISRITELNQKILQAQKQLQILKASTISESPDQDKGIKTIRASLTKNWAEIYSFHLNYCEPEKCTEAKKLCTKINEFNGGYKRKLNPGGQTGSTQQ